MVIAAVVAVVALLGVAVIVLMTGGPGLRLRLAKLTGAARFSVGSVTRAPDGLVAVERVGLAQGGEVSRISFVSVGGEVNSRLFDRYRRVLGVTGSYVWTDGPDRPSLRLPSLEDGPTQAEVLQGCSLSAVEVVVDTAAGRLRVTDSQGRIQFCDPETREVSADRPAPQEPAPETALTLQRAEGERFRLSSGGQTVEEGLLRPELVRNAATGGLIVFPGGDTVVAFRRSLTDDAPLEFGRFGSDGRRWDAVVAGGPASAESPVFVWAAGALFVVASSPSGAVVTRHDPGTGTATWSRAL